MLRAYVIYSNSDKPYLKGLKPGFRHVSLVLEIKDITGEHAGYVHVDPRMARLELLAVSPLDIMQMQINAPEAGITIQQVQTVEDWDRHALPAPYSCMLTIKRILGVRACWVLTPYQLYKYLNHSTKEE